MLVTRRSAVGLLTAAAVTAPFPALASLADAPPLRLVHLHTDETLTVTHRRGGRVDPGAMRAIDHFLRDWRAEAVAFIDPALLDFLCEVQTSIGFRGPIEVLSGYRSPATNAALSRRTRGVAKRSMHMEGRAIDLAFPGVPTRFVRDTALWLNRGGVGLYSRSQFVHLDTGRVRTWGR